MYRKIGGIHWLAIGRLRFSFCVTKLRQVGIPDDLIPFNLANLPAQIDPIQIVFLWQNRIQDVRGDWLGYGSLPGVY